MIEITIPGYRTLHLEHLVLDFNGTLAVDGCLMDGVRATLAELSSQVHVHVLTADTFGKAGEALDGVPCRLFVLPQDNQDAGKLAYVQQLGCERTVAMGNGRNDHLMLKEAALGVAVLLAEGVATVTANAADVLCRDIIDALDLLRNPLRLVATLRS
ncbi:MAG: ATPase P [Desulfobacterales bacterium]|nr:ATPase P [Desulfobacterales bacterium]